MTRKYRKLLARINRYKESGKIPAGELHEMFLAAGCGNMSLGVTKSKTVEYTYFIAFNKKVIEYVTESDEQCYGIYQFSDIVKKTASKNIEIFEDLESKKMTSLLKGEIILIESEPDLKEFIDFYIEHGEDISQLKSEFDSISVLSEIIASKLHKHRSAWLENKAVLERTNEEAELERRGNFAYTMHD
jgi:hypothetical protein